MAKKQQQKARAQKQKEARRKARQRKAAEPPKAKTRRAPNANVVDDREGMKIIGDANPKGRDALLHIFEDMQTRFTDPFVDEAPMEVMTEAVRALMVVMMDYSKRAGTYNGVMDLIAKDARRNIAGVYVKAIEATEDIEVRRAILEAEMFLVGAQGQRQQITISGVYKHLGREHLMEEHKQQLIQGALAPLPAK